jgi:hypothetical protein
MPLTPYPNVPAGFALCRFQFTLAGAAHDPMIIFGITDDGTSTPADLIDDAAEPFNSGVMPDLSSSLTLVSGSIVLNRGGTFSEGASTFGATAGGTGGQPVPPNTSILVPKSTGLIGKHFRGRIYVPGLPASAADSAQARIRATPLLAYQADFAGWLTALATASINMVLLHRSPAVSPTTVIGLGVEELLATQSRRLRKVAHR